MKWENICEAKPTTGIEIDNTELAEALADKKEFTNDELDAFQVSNLSHNSYIKVGDVYFKPVDLCQGGRMVGDLKEFKSGKFQDAAKGIESFLGVCKSWLKGKECTIEGIIAEVKRLCDCPKCAEVQARVLDELNRDREAELTSRLAAELSGLQEAQNNDAPTEAIHVKITATRAEIESVGGWVYGSDKLTPGACRLAG